MAQSLRWLLIATGAALLLLFLLFIVNLSIAMQPFGGIPWSLNFVSVNWRLFALPVMGMILILLAIYSLWRDKRRRG